MPEELLGLHGRHHDSLGNVGDYSCIASCLLAMVVRGLDAYLTKPPLLLRTPRRAQLCSS